MRGRRSGSSFVTRARSLPVPTNTPPPELLAGRELLLRIDIEDEAGRTASDTLTAIAALDPIDADTGAP